MRCAEFQRFATTWVDGELDGADLGSSEAARFAAHAAACASCRALAAEHEGYRLALAELTSRDAAPSALRARIAAGLDAADRNLRPSARGVFALAAALAAALLVPELFSSPVAAVEHSDAVAPIIEASVETHRRDLPVEVASNEPDEVCDWFSGKVDFPVRLPVFAVDEAPAQIVGARLSHIREQSAALVRYRVADAQLSVLVFPDDGRLDVPEPRSGRVGGSFFLENRSGYNVALFRDNGTAYAITTEMPRNRFANLVEGAELR
jgi:hypothetical protein